MLNKFFKDNLDSKKPATRLAAIERIDETQADNQSKLARIACADEDEGVRCAAVAKLRDPVCLAGLLGDALTIQHNSPIPPASPIVLDAARVRLEQLLSQPGQMDATSSARLAATGSREACVLIACHAVDEASRNAVLIMLDEQADIARVVTESRYHSTRMAAAGKLVDETTMASVAAAIKEKDKVVSRSLQERVDAKRAVLRRAQAHQKEITQLIETMQQLSESVWSPQYAARFSAVQDRWNKLDPDPSAEQKRHYDAYHLVSARKVDEYQHQQLAKEFCREALQSQIDLSRQLKTVSLAELGLKSQQIRQDSVNAHASWRVSVEAAMPEAATVKNYESTYSALHAELQTVDILIELKLNTITAEKLDLASAEKLQAALTASVGDVDEKLLTSVRYLSELAQIRRHVGSRIKQLKNENEAKVKSIHKQLGALAATLKEGKWSQANSLYARIEKKVGRLEGHQEHKSLLDRLARHKTKLDELVDWQNFAAKPKLLALCERMEQLPIEFSTESELQNETAKVDQDLASIDPKQRARLQELAARIKKLQNEWKELGPSPVANELWERFKNAADIAYAPVGLLRQQQHLEREARHQNKENICAELEAFIADVDWEEADWKLVERTLRNAKTGWRQNRIQDRKPDRALEQRFSKVVEQFNVRLDVQYNANARIKEELIEKVQKLAEADINQHAVNQTRKLQNSWKQTGIMRRKQDQELWEKFNGFCRTIYKQHHTAEKLKSDSSVAHVKQAKELIRSIKELSKQADTDENQFIQLQESFNALPEFPPSDKKYLLRDFNQASQQFLRAKEKNLSRAEVAEWAELIRKSRLCERYEALWANPPQIKPEKTPESINKSQQLQDLDAEWDETTIVLPKPWQKKIQKRRSAALLHISNETQFDFTESDKNRRLLCIKAEILTSRESPVEDRQLRMAYQLENLQQGLGNSALADTKAELKALALEWLCMAPGDPANRESLESRLIAAGAPLSVQPVSNGISADSSAALT